MAETESPTPQTASEPQLKAPKDKNCPFCGQAFTSSSLGRHLDLYIRPKNPKAPDGIHKVDEIRKMRGGITRRHYKGNVSTPRGSESGSRTPANKKSGVDSEDSSIMVDSPEPDDEELEVVKSRSQLRDKEGGNGSRRPSRLSTKTPDLRRDTSRQMQKADLEQRQKTSEEAEVASATEMALRELLRSVREASAKASGCNLFDFDPYTLSFPALCLQILPAPPTLFSPTPFSTSESWSVSPPGQKQFDALNRQVRERMLSYQHQRQINQAYPSAAQSNVSSAANSPLPTPPLVDFDPQKLFRHISEAYKHWTRHSEKTRQEHWQLEMLRCFSRAEERRRDAEVQLENAQREIEYLKCNRWASGASDVSPISIHLGRETARELGKYGMDFRNWDYDRLIEKWRSSIRDGRGTTSGMAAQKPLPGDSTSSRSASVASLQMSFAAINQPRQGSPVKSESAIPFTASPTVNGDACSDHLDAEGDDDDGDMNLTPPAVSDEDGMNLVQLQPPPQPSHQQPQQQHHPHGLPLQPTPMHTPQQIQSHIQNSLHVQQAQAQAHLQHAQAQAQAQAWAAAHQHMSATQNQDFRSHQHQQLSPHVLNSAANSRRPSLAMLDPLTLTTGSVNGLGGPMGMASGMEGIENHHQDHFLRLDLGLLGPNDVSVSLQ